MEKYNTTMKKSIVLYLAVITSIIFCSCELGRSISVYEPRQAIEVSSVQIVPNGQQVPQGYVVIGSASYGDTGLTFEGNCTYEAIIEQARLDGAKVGASIIYVSNVTAPNYLGTTCYNVTVQFYALQRQ